MEFDATQALEIAISDEDVLNASESPKRTHVALLNVAAHEGHGEQMHLLYKGENVIGRRSESHVTIPAKTISKRHAIIEITDDVHMIYDLESVNKTRRGKIVLKANVRYELQDGDILRFGDVICIYSKMTKVQVIGSDSDTETESLTTKSMPKSLQNPQMIAAMHEATNSGAGAPPLTKKPSSPTTSNNELPPTTAAAIQEAFEECNSDKASSPEILKPATSSHLELNNNVNDSKESSSKENEPAVARCNHVADFLTTGIILSESDYSDSDEDLITTKAPGLLVPETPACESRQTTSLTVDASPAVCPSRGGLGRLISSSDSDTDIDGEVKSAIVSTVDANDSSLVSRGDVSGDGPEHEINDLMYAETQVFPLNVAAEKSNSLPKPDPVNVSPPPADKPVVKTLRMRSQPTIVMVEDNMDCLELATQPNAFVGSFESEISGEDVTSTPKFKVPQASKPDPGRGEELENSDWESMATQPYVIKNQIEISLDDSDEEDIFEAATQMYPTRGTAIGADKLNEDSDLEKMHLADTIVIDNSLGSKAATRNSEDLIDLAHADTVPMELLEGENPDVKVDEAKHETDPEEVSFTSPSCTDEESVKLKQKIDEVLKSPALASQELQDGSGCKEAVLNITTDQNVGSENIPTPKCVPVEEESPVPEEFTKTKATRGRVTRAKKPVAVSTRTSTRRGKKSSAIVAEADEEEAPVIPERPSSAFRPYHKDEDSKITPAEFGTSFALKRNVEEEKAKEETVKTDAAKLGTRNRRNKLDATNATDQNSLTTESEDLKDKSPAVIGPTPPSRPPPRRSTAKKSQKNPGPQESDSSDSSQELANQRRSLRGSQLKKTASLEVPTRKVRRIPPPKAPPKRMMLQFDSSDDEATQQQPKKNPTASKEPENLLPKVPEKLVEENAPITESQWQRLEEEIAELSGEGKSNKSDGRSEDKTEPKYKSTESIEAKVAESTAEKDFGAKAVESANVNDSGKKSVDGTDENDSGAKTAKSTKESHSGAKPVESTIENDSGAEVAGSSNNNDSGTKMTGGANKNDSGAKSVEDTNENDSGAKSVEDINEKESGAIVVQKTSENDSGTKPVNDTIGEDSGAKSAKSAAADPEMKVTEQDVAVKPSMSTKRATKKPRIAESSPEIQHSNNAMVDVPRNTPAKGRRRRSSKAPALLPLVTVDLAENENVGSNKVDLLSDPKENGMQEEGFSQESKTATSRRGRSSMVRTTTSLPEKYDSESTELSADTQDEKHAGRSGELQNLKVPKSNLKQSKAAEDASDLTGSQGDKRVSWSQCTGSDTETDDHEAKKTSARTGRGARAKGAACSEPVERPEGKGKTGRGAKAKLLEDPKGQEEQPEKKPRAGRSPRANAVGDSNANESVPTPRTQRSTASKYRRLVVAQAPDSSIETTTTDYDSEPAASHVPTPVKQTPVRGKKAKVELDKVESQELTESSVKTYPKRAGAQKTPTPAKRRRGNAANEEPTASDESPAKKAGKREASPMPSVTKRSKMPQPETPAKAAQDSNTESLDEFEIKSPSPVRKARGKKSTAAKKTPQKGKAAAAAKGSPRIQSKNEAEGPPKIMFTGISEKSLEKIVKDLNGSLVDSVFDCTHLVTDKVRRTWKFLCMLARGCHIVSPAWLKQCKAEKSFIDATPYVISDESAEKQYKFKLDESLARARKESFLNGYRIHATKSVKPPPQEMQTIIKCAGGVYLARMPTSGNGAIVVTCPEDLHLCNKARNGGVAVVGTEFILTGVLRHVVEIEPYRC